VFFNAESKITEFEEKEKSVVCFSPAVLETNKQIDKNRQLVAFVSNQSYLVRFFFIIGTFEAGEVCCSGLGRSAVLHFEVGVTTEAYCYNSISCASSSLKSLILLSEDELTAVASA